MCKHPLKAFKIGINEKSGKPRYKICPLNTAYVWRFKDTETWYCKELYFLDFEGKKQLCDMTSIFNPRTVVSNESIEIPCGQCIECRLAYSRMWAERIMLEAKNHVNTWFVTLTYNDDNLPDNFSGMPEFENLHSLYPQDMTKFLKRLRKNSGQKFRYYYAGEYGSKTGRPHYHMILFGFDFDDLKLYKRTSFGDLSTSEFFEKTWGKGFCTIARCTFETAAYTARYVMKKRKGEDAQIFSEHGLISEFVRMSRKPGIAREYFDENYQDIYETDEIFIETRKGGKKFTPPRYFDSLYEALDPDSFLEIKENRRIAAETIRKLKLQNTSVDYEQMLKNEENNLIKRTSKLVRPL